MKTYKRWIAGVLSLLLLLSPVSVMAQTVAKLEIVYAKMGADGLVEDVFVVNGFEQEKKKRIDYGAYEEVINLTNADPLKLLGDRVEIETEDYPFYYQGKAKEAELPWKAEFLYKLDGKTLPPEELAGRDGLFGMDITIQANPKANTDFSDSYVLQIMVNLPSDRFEEVEAEGGVIASQGETTLITFTALPGEDAHYTIRAKGSHMELGAIQMAGLPYSMDIDLPDLSEYTDDLLALQNAISALTDGVGDFTGGVGSIYQASGELQSGAQGLSSGAYALHSGLAELSGGMQEYQAGLDLYVSELEKGLGGMEMPDMDLGGLSALTDGSAQLFEGLTQLEEGMQHLGPEGEFAQGLDEVTKGAEALSAGMDELMYGKPGQPGLLEASDSINDALKQMADALTTGMPQLEEEGLNQIAAGLEQFIQGMKSFLTGLDAAVRELDPARLEILITQLYDLRESLAESAYTLRNPGVDLSGIDAETNPEAFALYGVMQKEAERIETRLHAIDEAIALVEDTEHLLDDINTMREATLEMIQGARKVVDEIGEIDILSMMKDIEKLIEGIVLLSTNYEAFNDGLHMGLTAIKKGMDNPLENPPGLVQGLRALRTGYAQMTTPILAGMAALVPGAGQLAAGISLMVEKLTELAGQFDFGDALDELLNGSRQLRDGHRAIAGGAKDLTTGLGTYASGVEAYARGMAQFQAGMRALANGGSDLAAGMRMLNDETSGMDQQMQEQMNEMMDSFLPGEAPTVSFVSAKNPEPVRVQFLYMSQAVHAPEEEEEPAPVEEDKGIWERILDLFR